MKISIITVVYNNVSTIKDCIETVQKQSYPDIEHIIIDGCSSDGTVDVVKSCGNKIAKFVSELDKGIYDAMNKGLKLAQGEIIGILNSDDLYADDSVLERVVEIFKKKGVDSCYGDIVYVDRTNTNKVIRYWQSGEYKRGRFLWGWMPPHPAFFVKRSVYEKYGLFNLDFPLAADYELMLRFLYKASISTAYIPKVLVKMRAGGSTNLGLATTARMLRENYQAWKVNGLKPRVMTVVMKPLLKVSQFWRRFNSR